MSDGEVISLFPPDEDEDQPLVKQEVKWCAHRQTQLDSDARRVHCRACGREIDPFEVLLALCDDYERYVRSYKEVQRRARVAHANLEALLREERNAKARKKNRIKTS